MENLHRKDWCSIQFDDITLSLQYFRIPLLPINRQFNFLVESNKKNL